VKRTISLVIALTISFVMMFGSIAKTEEIKVPISVSALKPTKLEAVKAPAAKTNKTNSPPPEVKASALVLEERKQVGDRIEPQWCNVTCPNGKRGYWDGLICVTCQTQNNPAN
jgi:hypothetical protein